MHAPSKNNWGTDNREWTKKSIFQVAQINRNCMMSCTVPCGGVSFSSGCRLAADSGLFLGLSFANRDSVQTKDS